MAWAVLFTSHPVLPKLDSQCAKQPSNPGHLLPSLDGLFSRLQHQPQLPAPSAVSVRPFPPTKAAVPGLRASVPWPPCICVARGRSWLPWPCPPFSALLAPRPHFFSQVLSSLPSSSRYLHKAPTLAPGHCLSVNEDRDRPDMGSPCQLCCS